jgi:hypothetical protein
MSTTETTSETAETPRESGFHAVNVGHLVMGVAFLGLTVVWILVVAADAVDIEKHGWIMGVPWLFAGAVGLAATALRNIARRGSAH